MSLYVALPTQSNLYMQYTFFTPPYFFQNGKEKLMQQLD